MKKFSTGLVAGLTFGIADLLLMIPIPLSDKPIAMLGAFINRFAIGFLIVYTEIMLPSSLKGLLIGLLLSLPDAIITRTYLPILGVGGFGGLIIGYFVGKQKSRK